MAKKKYDEYADTETPQDYHDEASPVHNQVETPAANGEKPHESKRDKFVRLVERRMSRALKTIGYVQNLGNRNQYEYTEDEAAQVVADLTAAVNQLRQAFLGKIVTTQSWRLKR